MTVEGSAGAVDQSRAGPPARWLDRLIPDLAVRGGADSGPCRPFLMSGARVSNMKIPSYRDKLKFHIPY